MVISSKIFTANSKEKVAVIAVSDIQEWPAIPGTLIGSRVHGFYLESKDGKRQAICVLAEEKRDEEGDLLVRIYEPLPSYTELSGWTFAILND